MICRRPMRGLDDTVRGVHNAPSLFVSQAYLHGGFVPPWEVHKEIKRALRKKTQAQEDSDTQAEEEEEKESA